MRIRGGSACGGRFPIAFFMIGGAGLADLILEWVVQGDVNYKLVEPRADKIGASCKGQSFDALTTFLTV